MANFILRKFSDKSYNIVKSGKTVGEVRIMPVSGLWMAVLHSKHRVINYSAPLTAFRAVVMAHNVAHHNTTASTPLIFTLEKGRAGEHQETLAYNEMLHNYVDALNKNLQPGENSYRVIKRRRR